jgi:phosphate transport system protein
MPAIEPELQALRDNLLDMLSLVRNQMVMLKEAIQENNHAKAEDVLAEERNINIQEIAIDRDCESILALYTPVATDLRLVLATLKMTNDLERIGDSAKSVAKFLLQDMKDVPKKWLKEFCLDQMLDILVVMLKDMGEALRKEDTRLALKTAKKDEHLNDFNKKAFKTTADLILANPDHSKALLMLFSLTRNLERAGDLTKNIAEELVFHIEARVVKHKKNHK